MQINVVISDDDSIVIPNVHDANILGLVMVSKNKLLLPIHLVDGSNVCIVLNDVVCLRSDDFREGNIVLDITVSRGSAVEMSEIAYAHGLEKFLSSESSLFLKKSIQDFLKEKRILVQVNPSFGCRLVCICGEIEATCNEDVFINGIM
jgi:hypothetical protein